MGVLATTLPHLTPSPGSRVPITDPTTGLLDPSWIDADLLVPAIGATDEILTVVGGAASWEPNTRLESVVAGANVTVDNTDPLNPIIAASGGGGGGGDIDWANPVSVTGTTTITASGVGKVHLCTGVGSDYTVTLPDSGMTAGDIMAFQMGTSSTLTKLVTLDATAGNLIDDVQTRIMHDHEVAILKWDGANWCKVGGKSIAMVCSIVPSVSQTLSSNLTIIKLTMPVAEVDIGASADTANSRIVIRRAGKYILSGGVLYDSAQGTATGFNTAHSRIHVNGSFVNTLGLYVPTTVARPHPQLSVPMTFAQGDYIEMNAYIDMQGVFANQIALVSVSGYKSRLMVQEILEW